MADAVFPQQVPDLISTLVELFRHSGRGDLVELLESASADVDLTEYDNWNGGTCTWALRIKVPISLFAAFESASPVLEKELVSKLGYIGRLHANHSLAEVTITPLAPGAPAGSRMHVSERDVARLWPAGGFRLFISHVSTHKVEVTQLKAELALRGIEAFVAHQAIEPSKKWQDELEIALRSMHALVAILTLDFHGSKWTDQEVGWALGRGIPVIPVRCGGPNPYGLAGKYQAVAGSFDKPAVSAAAILQILLKNEQTHGEMRRSLVRTFCTSESFVQIQALKKVIVKITDFTSDQKAAMLRACSENKIVAEAYNVPEAIQAAFGKPVRPAGPAAEKSLPF